MFKKLAEWFRQMFIYPPELKEMQKRALETNRIYEQALEKAKPALKKATTRTKELKMAVKPSKTVAKKVTKEMEYDYKTGKKSFAGSTVKKDAHAEKEGKKVAKALAYDINKAKKKK